MAKYTCEVCGKVLGSPAALGSHLRVHQPKAKKLKHSSTGSMSVEEALVLIADKLASGEPAKLYTCLDCSGELELMPSGPGIYQLRCRACWEGK